MRIAPAFVVASITVVAATADAQASKIEEFVRAEMARQRVPGVAVAVVKNGTIVSARGYGYANVEHEVPVTDQTIFQSGSLGKQFTAAAVMLQVEDGKLSLSDTITRFFPDASPAWRAITVRHLLTHTSGIPDYTDDKFDYRKDYTEDQLARFAYELPLEFPPGSRWNYSNTGYLLLGVIVHRVSGKFYGDVLTERVFTPLGMTTTRVISEEDIVPHRSAGYRSVSGQLKNQEWVAPTLNTTADGALYFSLRDLIAWDAGVRARRILKPDSWRVILEAVHLNSGKTYPYGFGWRLDERGGQRVEQHSGSWQGFRTHYARFLGDDLSIIVLANLAQASPARFVDGIAAIMNPRLALQPRKPIDDREPQVTTRIVRLIDAVREGKLIPADFAYANAAFSAGTANSYAEQLTKLGAVQRMLLLERRELGDDRIYVYDVTLANGERQLEVGLAPDNRLILFQLRQRP
jgi:CubicO group peptidase (beta-lactamase class C family)